MSLGDKQEWLKHFPALAAVDDPVWHALRASARIMQVPAGTVVFRDSDPCRSYLLVIHGTIRVQKTAENGREITLYRVEDGQTCVLTTSCLLAGNAYPAEGITETDVTAVSIPLAQFQKGLNESPGFRRFVFSAYGERISSLIVLVEEIAFGRLDARLAGCLLQRADSAGEVESTHQALAAELGTAREVVSRQLKEFERRGWIHLQRGRVRLLDREALADLTV